MLPGSVSERLPPSTRRVSANTLQQFFFTTTTYSPLGVGRTRQRQSPSLFDGTRQQVGQISRVPRQFLTTSSLTIPSSNISFPICSKGRIITTSTCSPSGSSAQGGWLSSKPLGADQPGCGDHRISPMRQTRLTPTMTRSRSAGTPVDQ